MAIPKKRNPAASQEIRGDGAIGVQVGGDYNSVTIFAGSSTLVLDQPHKRRGVGPPTNERQLLLTEWRATKLVGRDGELSALKDWRGADPLISVRCITGRAGSGKTRLAIEACEMAEADGWTTGFATGEELRRFDAAQNLAQWRSPEKDTLIVVDDAATSAAVLKRWFAALAQRPARAGDQKLRILLLERYADAKSEYGWWAELRRSESRDHAEARDILGAERPVPLPTITETEERRALLAEAMLLASGILGRGTVLPPRAGADHEFDRRLADNRLENEPLFLVMAGIVAVDHGAPAALALGRIELAKEMAALERVRLARLGVSWGLSADGDLIAHLAACATLQRGCDFGAAKALISAEVAAIGLPLPFRAEKLAEMLAEALPNQSGDGIDRVRPDLIGEAFLVREVTGPRARSDDERLAIIERARDRDEKNVLETLVLAAQDFAAGAANHSTVRWLAELAHRSADLSGLIRILNAIPQNTLALRELGALLNDRIINLLRQDPNAELNSVLPHALGNFGFRLSELGNRDGALSATQEALGIWRRLAASKPDTFQGELAAALNNLGSFLANVGRLEDALAAAEESVDTYRLLAADRPDVFNPDFGVALNNLANRLSQLGRREPALAAIREGTEIYRALTAAKPDAFAFDLGGTLTNLASRLSEFGEHEAALSAGKEAVEIYRKLAAGRPDAFNPFLATSLNNLANRFQYLGQREAALGPAQEALELRRALAAERPDVFNSDLATSLNNMAGHLSNLDRKEEALAASHEATELNRLLAATRPDAFIPELAASINNQASHLRALERNDDALVAAHEAVELYRRLSAARPEAFNADLAMSLSVLGDMLEVNGALVEAVEKDLEAVAVLAPSFLALPSAFGRPMWVYMRDYARRAEAAGIEMDFDVVAPILEKFVELRRPEEDAD